MAQKKIIANWKDDYTLMGIGVDLIGSGIGIVEVVRRLDSNKKKTTYPFYL